MTGWPKCAGCHQVAATHEILQPIAGNPPFPEPVYTCEAGSKTLPSYLVRRLHRSDFLDSSPGEQHASQPDAVGHGRRAAALRAGVGE